MYVDPFFAGIVVGIVGLIGIVALVEFIKTFTKKGGDE